MDTRRPDPGGGDNPLFSKAADPALEPAPDREPPSPPPGRGRRRRRIVAAIALGTVLVLGLASAAMYLFVERLGNNVARVPDVFARVDRAPRPPVIGERISFLLVGTDSRSESSRRGEMLMLARIDIDQDRTGASVVSIPRNSMVDIPGLGRDRIDTAYNSGGPALLLQTVEQLTDVRLDHFAVIDFDGFQGMVDAVGGIDMQTDRAASEAGVRFAGGVNHFDGAQALAYLRQRDSVYRGDVDRAAPQQNALRAMLDKAATAGLLADPIQLYALLDAVTRAVSVDDTLDNNALRGLGLEMRNLRASGVQFVVTPVSRVEQQGERFLSYLDDARAAQLWEALRTDTVTDYAKRNPADALSGAPR